VADLDLDGRGAGGLYAGEPGAATRTGELALTGLAGGTLTFAGGAPATFSFAGGEAPPPPASPAPDAEPAVGAGRGIPAGGPWLAFYGSAGQLAARFGSLEEAARRFRLFVIDADPMANHFTSAQIATLKAGGANRVLSYLDVGSVEASRSYWSTVERAGYVPAKELTTAQLGPYGGYPDEVWMDPADRAWHHLLMGYAVPKLVAGTERGGQAVDGLFLDNMELAEHGDADANGPCNAGCRYATYDVVRELRERYPRLLLVANGATDAASRAMALGPVRYAELLDGVVRESAFVDAADPQGREQLAAWRALGLWAGGRPTWIGTIDYVDACDAAAARAVRAASEAEGFFPFVAGTLDHLSGLCTW
jgi:cysteinyl-tRNA synthetase